MNLDKEIFDIAIADIMPNRFQPREMFDDKALEELSTSIKEHGVIQPIIVRKVGDKYEIIAGERRYRASKLAGKQTIPAIVKDMDDKEAAKVALLENLQRKDLTPIEEARTYQTILKLDDMTQEELATNLGKSQSTIANKLRLLQLDDEVQTALLNEKISERHARSLLNIEDKARQRELLNQIIINRMTVKQLDDEISKITGKQVSTDDAINLVQTENTSSEQTANFVSPSTVDQTQSTQDQYTTPSQAQQTEVQPEQALNFASISLAEKTQPTQDQYTTPSQVQQTETQPQQTLNFASISLAEKTQPTQDQIAMPSQAQQEEFSQETNQNTTQTSLIQDGNNISLTAEPATITPAQVQTIMPETNPQEINIMSTTPKDLDQNVILQTTPIINSTQEQTSENFSNTNIFSSLRTANPIIQNEITGIKEEIPSSNETYEQSNNMPQASTKQPYGNIYDLRFAINNVRQAIQNTEKFGFKITSEEFDLEDTYQIVIKIDKNK